MASESSVLPWAAIVLCGGQSRRMGQSKAWLPFGQETMLARVVRVLGQVSRFCQLVVVAAPEQQLPSLPAPVRLARDAVPGRGPLEGMAAGLNALTAICPDVHWACYVTSCDVPLLRPAFVEAVCARLGEADAVVPVQSGRHHPLAAAYRSTVLPVIRRLLADDQLRPRALYKHIHTVYVPVDELREADPDLHSLQNVNTRDDYLWALKAAGLADPSWAPS